MAMLAAGMEAGEPIRLHPENPHYFLFRGKPTVLVTSAEHYGAVLNGRFDYLKYLDTLAADGMNMTRVFMGAYRELPGDFNIARNTLAPAFGDFVAPWARSSTGGARDGLNKFDLTKWNDAYFRRLRDFAAQAGRRGIVVEVTLFCPYYQERMWEHSPLHEANNVNGVGKMARAEVYKLGHPEMLQAQEGLVRKVLEELREFDNVYYEICNEPYAGRVASEWQRHISGVIVETEKKLGVQHLIAQNIANNTQKITDPDPNVGLFNFHYARPPAAVEENYGLNKAIGLDETGFDGTGDAVYRIQAWDFLAAGGAHYNNLDYSFTVGHEDGTFEPPGTTPGWGSKGLRRQLRGLRQFLEGFDLVKMRPSNGVIGGGVPEGMSARALVEPGKAWAIYVHGGKVLKGYRPQYVVLSGRQKLELRVALPAGRYKARWWNPRSGEPGVWEGFGHDGGLKALASPEIAEDAAVEIRVR
jgi:hypothetical protein